MMLPRVNAILNSMATILLVIGFIMIRRGKWKAHRNVMLAAFGMSVIFLVSYVTYHYLSGGISTPFGGTGAIRIVYYFILFTHIVLAAIVPVLAIITLNRGLRKRYPQHRKIARWTYPIWLYVSVTGVLVYLMLYEWFPAADVLLGR